MHSTFSHSRNTVRETYIFRLAIGRMANKRQKQTVYKIYTRERRKKQQLKQIITYVDSISNMLMMDLFFCLFKLDCIVWRWRGRKRGSKCDADGKKRAKWNKISFIKQTQKKDREGIENKAWGKCARKWYSHHLSMELPPVSVTAINRINEKVMMKSHKNMNAKNV